MAGKSTRRAAYAVLLVVVDKRGQEVEQHEQQGSNCVACAIHKAHDTECTWMRLVGAQWQPLRWYVIDTRNYERLNPWRLINEGVQHGCNKGKNRRVHA